MFEVFLLFLAFCLTLYSTFLTTKGGLTDNRNSSLKNKITKRGKKFISVSLITFIITLILFSLNRDSESKLKKERNRFDSTLIAKVDSINTDKKPSFRICYDNGLFFQNKGDRDSMFFKFCTYDANCFLKEVKLHVIVAYSDTSLTHYTSIEFPKQETNTVIPMTHNLVIKALPRRIKYYFFLTGIYTDKNGREYPINDLYFYNVERKKLGSL